MKLTMTGNTFAQKGKDPQELLLCNVVFRPAASAIFVRDPTGEKGTMHRLAHSLSFAWIARVALFAVEIVGAQAPPGNDPWLRSLDLSIPESHDKRVGVYDVLKGVENTPSDNLLFAVARDVLATYELSKPFLEELIRVHQQLRARQRENRKGGGANPQNGTIPSGAIIVQTVQPPTGKKRQKRHAGNMPVEAITPVPAAGLYSPAAIPNVSQSDAAPSRAEKEGSVAVSRDNNFVESGGPKVQQMQQQQQQPVPPRHHGMRLPTTVMHSREVDAGRGVSRDSRAWWSGPKAKRSDERFARKQGLPNQEGTLGSRGSHMRRKYTQGMSGGQVREQERARVHMEQQSQYVSEPDTPDTEHAISTSSM